MKQGKYMAVVISVMAMLILCLLRVNVILALIMGAIVGGITASLSLAVITESFTHGAANAAGVALSYGLLGAFANGLAHSGVTEKLAQLFHKNTGKHSVFRKTSLLLVLLLMGIASQNIIPVHIAFIPVVIPPLLVVFNQMKIDRRLIACIITFGITCTYMTVPVGFGNIYLNHVLKGSLASNGLHVLTADLPLAMLIPGAGMVVGLFIAVFCSYRKARTYSQDALKSNHLGSSAQKKVAFLPIALSIVTALVVQLLMDSMIMGALAGCLVMLLMCLFPRKNADAIFMEGFRIMAPCGFIMMAASGFAAVLQETGSIPQLVQMVSGSIPSKSLLVFLMLLVGLLITMGIGSSFSTVPILAAIYVPIAVHMGLSSMAIIALVGTAGALGDAGSPASDSTIGPTSGLNMDGQHDHMRDTVIPTFLHYNIPLLVAGWIAVMVL